MSALDTIAGVAVGAYLVAVAVNGNSAALIDQAKKDKAFLKWGWLDFISSIPMLGIFRWARLARGVR